MLCRMIAASQMQFLNTWNWTNVTDEVIFHLLLINVNSHMWFVTNVLNSKVLDKVSCLALFGIVYSKLQSSLFWYFFH